MAHPAETGPIRPPSESGSLLVRLSRNCPWNRCLFCPVYKAEQFSLRTADELKSEISYLASLRDRLKACLETMDIRAVGEKLEFFFGEGEIWDARRILHWIYHGEFNVFLQDADPLFRKRRELTDLIAFLKEKFPETQRITAYSRANTIARLSPDELSGLKKAGLGRIHTGLESGSDRVLNFVKKGIKSEDVIAAGKLLNQAGIEFSLYFMPGLGGKKLSGENLSETIRVINSSFPTFVRLRSLAMNPDVPLYSLYQKGLFEILSEDEMVGEIESLIRGITVPVTVYSDHSLNLLMEVNGKLPGQRDNMLRTIRRYKEMPDDLRLKFIIARRLNSVFEIGEFIGFKIQPIVDEYYNKISQLTVAKREEIFMDLRSNNM
jgi:radical SAM superfamily enzyme YgiQ (UPF0313 family)